MSTREPEQRWELDEYEPYSVGWDERTGRIKLRPSGPSGVIFPPPEPRRFDPIYTGGTDGKDI